MEAAADHGGAGGTTGGFPRVATQIGNPAHDDGEGWVRPAPVAGGFVFAFEHDRSVDFFLGQLAERWFARFLSREMGKPRCTSGDGTKHRCPLHDRLLRLELCVLDVREPVFPGTVEFLDTPTRDVAI